MNASAYDLAWSPERCTEGICPSVVSASAYDLAWSPDRCTEGLCPSCDTCLFGSASTGLWCPDCDTDWSWPEARCPYPATATTSEGERLCGVHAALADDVWHDSEEC